MLGRIGLGILVGAGLMLAAGCANMVEVKRTVNGREVTTWADPETAKRMQAEEVAKQDRATALRTAPKRKAGEPVRVALFRFTVAENLSKALDQDKLFEAFRKALAADKVIQLVDQKTVDQAWQDAQKQRGLERGQHPHLAAADVSVFPHAMADEAVGISKSTGKVASMAVLVLKADVESHYFPEDDRELKDKENIFKNLELTRRFAAKVADVVKKDLGPNLPSLAYLQSEKEQQKQQFMDQLKKALGGK